MEPRRVILLGEPLAVEAVGRILGSTRQLHIVGVVQTARAALAAIRHHGADVLIGIGSRAATRRHCLNVLSAYPELPLIYSNVGTSTAQVITSRSIEARLDRLLVAISACASRDDAPE
jgi:hypothetical protein